MSDLSLCHDRNGTEIDIEVQGNAEGAHVRRARYHSSVVDSRMLKEGQKFKELKDSYRNSSRYRACGGNAKYQ